MAVGKYKELLKSFGFQSFLWTQFFGALNDNFYKIILSLLAINIVVGTNEGSQLLPLIGAIFILPFFLFSGYAGNIADRFNKRSVLIATKCLEVVTMGIAPFALISGNMEFMLVILFLMALQSTFFSPAKYGILPEMIPNRDLSRANGLLEMSTFLAIILGTSIGSLMFASWRNHLFGVGLILFLIAIAGTLTSLGIPHVPAAGSQRRFGLNPWSEVFAGLKRLYSEKTLWLTVVGISYFWFLGALLQMDLLLLGKEVMNLTDFWIGILTTFLAIGIGIGSIVAGRLSGDKVELGLVPLGSIGMGVFSILLSFSSNDYTLTAVNLILLGFSGGLFIVPLHAFLQQKSGKKERGNIIATNNILNTTGILLASAALWILSGLLQVPADRVILIFGCVTIGGTIYLLTILPDFLIRFTLWLLTHSIYRIRIVGQGNVPFQGPALLVCNHMSHVDGLLVGACLQRFVRFLVYKSYYEMKGLHWLFRLMKAIPVMAGNPKEVAESLERAREELRQGHVVCIFAEGAISRTGNLLPFKRGFERILERMDVPVIPVHLDRLWGSVFSFKKGKFFGKWPERIPFPVTVSFGKPLPSSIAAQEARQSILELGSEAVSYRRDPSDLLHIRFIKTAKRYRSSFCMADSSGRNLSFGKSLVGSLLLGRWIREHCKEEKMLGLLLPASVGGALANIAVLLAGKVPVNLNFTAGREAITQAAVQCGIRTILSSRVFLSKAKLEEMEGMVFLEEIMKEFGPVQKIVTMLFAFLAPALLLQYIYRKREQNTDSLATVIFSSGSTGVPKGVMLSHQNILSNVEGLAQIFWVTKEDRMMGVLPFFHSFGFTGTLWFPLLTGFGAVYHPNPMDAKTIGEMVFQHKATILISTPTFYAAYMRKCTPEEFSSLRFAIVGAERLRKPVAVAFKEKYGLDLLEGYGCTEMSPVVSVNIPDVHDRKELQTGTKPGTVGHPIPGISVKVVDPETRETLSCGKEGLLLVKGPNQMLGYLGQAEKTKEVIKEDWYCTGDIALIDEDGFIQITDCLSRFSKIGGEMVPHIKIEEAINEILGDPACVVSAVPDKQKGERLIVLYTNKEIMPEALWVALGNRELPKLWIPKQENFYCVEAIPTLGTGKTDLRRVKALALEMAQERVP